MSPLREISSAPPYSREPDASGPRRAVSRMAGMATRRRSRAAEPQTTSSPLPPGVTRITRSPGIPEQAPPAREVPHGHQVGRRDLDAPHALAHGDPHRPRRPCRGRRPERGHEEDEERHPARHRRERKARTRLSTTLMRIDVVSGK